MGVIGRYLDSLDDEARDRVIQAQERVSGEFGPLEWTEPGPRCLIGHAAPPSAFNGLGAWFNALPDDHAARDVVNVFDDLFDREDLRSAREGAPRLTRAIKLRAANPKNRLAPSQPPSLSTAEALGA